MQVRAAVIECGEQEGCIRHTYHPVAEPVLEDILRRIITQTGFGQIYRADASQYVLVHLIGCIIKFSTILGAARNIIGIVDQQNEIVSHIFIRFNDAVVELLQQCIVS